jgi:uncharacterized protein YjdB
LLIGGVMKRLIIGLALVLAALLFASCEDAVSGSPGNPGADEHPVAVTGVSLDRENLTLVPGAEETLTVTVEPENAANPAVTWKSDKEDVATVDEYGKVTGGAEGTALITVTTKDGGKTMVCFVTVDPTVISVTGVHINTDSLHTDGGSLWIKEEEIAVLTAAVSPPEAANQAVKWESSNPVAAEVDENNGKILGVAAGSTTITVTTADGGFADTCEVTVKPKVTGVTLDQSNLTLGPGESRTLAAAVAPEGAPDKSVTWKSDKEAVAAVDKDGKVTGVATGKAKITVTTTDGSFTDTCEVTVTGVSLDHDSVVIPKGGSTILIATVLPEDAPDKSVTWKSDKEAVAAVDGNGTVTGVGAGTTVITATMTAGGYTAECVVEVTSDEVTYTVNSTETWTAALAAISAAADGSAGSPRFFVLHITGDFGVRGNSTTDPSITGNYKEVWLTGEGTISLDFSIEGPGEFPESHSIILVAANQIFIIDGPTLKGNTEKSHALVKIWGGAVELRNGQIKDNIGSGSYGCGVYVSGTFTMKGGTISGNSGSNGGGVQVYNGTFIMDGGTITGNGDTSSDGGGVYFYNDSAAFIMNNGAITNNTGRYGGGVCVVSGTFTMNGGTISGNKAATNSNKNGVYYDSENSFIRNGGEWQTD